MAEQAQQLSTRELIDGFVRDFNLDGHGFVRRTGYDARNQWINEEIVRPLLGACDLSHPFLRAVSAAVDRTSELVRRVERNFNPASADGNSPFVPEVTVMVADTINIRHSIHPDLYRRFAVGTRRMGNWRVVCYSWLTERGDASIPLARRRRLRCKPWLECSLEDKWASLSGLPDLIGAYRRRMHEMALLAEANKRHLQELDASVLDAFGPPR